MYKITYTLNHIHIIPTHKIVMSAEESVNRTCTCIQICPSLDKP